MSQPRSRNGRTCSQLLGESSEANGGADDDDDDGGGGGAAGATTEAAGASLRRAMPRVVTVTFEWSKETPDIILMRHTLPSLP